MHTRDHEILKKRLLNLARGKNREPARSRPAAQGTGEPRASAPLGASRRRTTTQLLRIAQKWSWPVVSSGVISGQQFNLSDRMPASLDPEAPFESSAASLSRAYEAFLYLLAPSFQPATLLDEARTILRRPPDAPADAISPQGWSKVLDDAGILRWEPAYFASAQPDPWISDVEANGGNGGVLEFPATSEAAHSDGDGALTYVDAASGHRKAVSPGAVRGVEVYAEAWDTIAITPGDWYHSEMLALGRTGPFLPEWVSTAQERTAREKTLFGDDSSLLRGRIAGLIVAYKPDFAIHVDDEPAPELERQMAGASRIHIGGFVFERPAAEPEAPLVRRRRAAGHTQLTGGSGSPGPYVVAVTIEEIG